MRSLHASGWVKASDARVRAQVAEWAVQSFDFISHTEAVGRRHVLADHPGFELAQVFGVDGQAEVALMVMIMRWRVVSVEAVELSSLGIPRRGGQRPYALHVVVKDHATGQWHHRLIIHMPSGVEGLTGLRRNEQARVWRDAARTLAAYVAGLDGPAVITGDWNVNLRRDWVRALLADLFPGFEHTPLPKRGGTHGRRFIDFSLARGIDLTAARVVPNQASDHRALIERARIKEKAVTKGIYPAAKLLLIPPGSNDPAIVPRIAVLHVDAGNAVSLHDFFASRSGGIESHFHVRKDGVVEQYRNIFWQADANLNANDFSVSIETQGFGAGEWTVAQIAAIKALLLWLHSEADIPLIRCTAWNGKGVGYHVMFGAPGPWTPVAKSCPGPDRIRQFDTVLVPWMKTALAPAPTTPTRVSRARVLLTQALKFAGPRRKAAIKAALDRLPKR